MADLEIPIIDFSGFYSDEPNRKQAVVDQVRKSCLYNGFFQIINHSVPLAQQDGALSAAKKFFTLPQEEKDKVSKNNNTWNRGYEMLRSQILEEGTQPELKEGFYIGAYVAVSSHTPFSTLGVSAPSYAPSLPDAGFADPNSFSDLPATHPYFINKKLNSGPNQWPEGLGSDLGSFKTGTMDYYNSTFNLASDLLRVIALSLDLEENFFAQFADGAVATMRLLHYPSQPKDAEEKLTRGIGAHTDFGAITMLLQDEVDGLQVWDQRNQTWIDVEPTKGALVVNLGNLMQRWTNEKYKSNVHRVINKSGKERYSIPVFLSGNPDFLVECIPTCRAPEEPAKFEPITVQQAVSAAYAESYGRAQKYKQGLEKAIDSQTQPQTVQV
ncbi:2OG-Fe(II)oxygenase superfamily protein [Seiridium cupressi]